MVHEEEGRDRLWTMETSMEEFYSNGRGKLVEPEQLRDGLVVAALYSDGFWHRADVV